MDQFIAARRAAGFTPVGHLVWVKNYASSRGLLAYQHESAFLLAKGHIGARPSHPLPDVLDWHNTGNRFHPTQKPVPSLRPVIEAFTKPGDIVLDPFCGSGSTLLAAKILICPGCDGLTRFRQSFPYQGSAAATADGLQQGAGAVHGDLRRLAFHHLVALAADGERGGFG